MKKSQFKILQQAPCSPFQGIFHKVKNSIQSWRWFLLFKFQSGVHWHSQVAWMVNLGAINLWWLETLGRFVIHLSFTSLTWCSENNNQILLLVLTGLNHQRISVTYTMYQSLQLTSPICHSFIGPALVQIRKCINLK